MKNNASASRGSSDGPETQTDGLAAPATAAEARASAVLEAVHDAVICIDATGRIEQVNGAAEKLFGYGCEELLGRNVTVLMPEPHRSRHASYIARYLQSGEARVIGVGREVTAVRKDGTVFPLRLAVTRVEIEGRLGFVGVLHDMTEWHANREELRRMAEELQRNNAQLNTLLNQLHVGMVVLDAESRIEFVSAEAEQILGTDGSESRGKRWDETDLLRPVTAGPLDPVALGSAPEPLFSTARSPAEAGRTVHMDCVPDPRDPSKRLLLLHDVSEVWDLRRILNDEARCGGLLGRSGSMQKVFAQIGLVAGVNSTVLLEGETGTGKELAARAIHMKSARRNGPFIALNCAGLSETLVPGILFGHKRGAFTGAVADNPGVFEAADGGTLFLDEIGDIPLAVQPALLRALQEREITRLGETQARKLDFRLVAATNRDLLREANSGRFRRDLLYRIRVAVVTMPPLRDRREDIPLLARGFLREACAAMGKKLNGFSNRALSHLVGREWPGNVRELRNAVEVAVIHALSNEVTPADLMASIPPESAPGTSAVELNGGWDYVDRAGTDRRRLIDALRRTEGNRAAAAKILGVDRSTLYRRMRRLGLDSRGGDPKRE